MTPSLRTPYPVFSGMSWFGKSAAEAAAESKQRVANLMDQNDRRVHRRTGGNGVLDTDPLEEWLESDLKAHASVLKKYGATTVGHIRQMDEEDVAGLRSYLQAADTPPLHVKRILQAIMKEIASEKDHQDNRSSGGLADLSSLRTAYHG